MTARYPTYCHIRCWDTRSDCRGQTRVGRQSWGDGASETDSFAGNNSRRHPGGCPDDAAGGSPRHVVRVSEEGDREAVVHRGALACGVERWWIKTGIDPGARSVN